MGIFDFFKKKKSDDETTTVQCEEIDQNIDSELKHEQEEVIFLQSVYERIVSALDDDGNLSADFQLFDYMETEQMKFSMGALDGIGIYHTPDQDATVEANYVYDLLVRLVNEEAEDTLVELGRFLTEKRLLGLVDTLVRLIYQSRESLPSDQIYRLAYRFMVQETNIELVKLGIALCALLNVEEQPEFRSVILTLAKCSEFTLYSLVSLGGWRGRNEVVFQLAKETNGWGKVHAVERLEPDTGEIRDWILCYGCDNGGLSFYSGLTCANKGNMIEALRQDILPKKVLKGAAKILTAILDEGPVAGISQYDDAKEALERFAVHAKRGRVDLSIAETTLMIYKWLIQSEFSDELKEKYWRIIEKNQWYDLVDQVLLNEDYSQIRSACSVADQMNYDIHARLLQLVEKEPLQYIDVIPFLCKNVNYAKQLFQIYEERLLSVPLQGNEKMLFALLSELKRYPKQGMVLVNKGLQSDDFLSRKAAIEVLEEWKRISGDSIVEISEQLDEILNIVEKDEHDGNLKGKINQLLNRL